MSAYRGLSLGLIGLITLVSLYLAANHWQVAREREAAAENRIAMDADASVGAKSIVELWHLKYRASTGDIGAAWTLARYYVVDLGDETTGAYWKRRAEELGARATPGWVELSVDEVRSLRLRADAGDADAADALANDLEKLGIKLGGMNDKSMVEFWRNRARELRSKEARQ